MTREEKIKNLIQLKANSGSHSPSPKEIVSLLGYDPIEHDFCFLSNPYATDLIVTELKNTFSDKKKIFKLLEQYPANSDYVAKRLEKFEKFNPLKIVIGNGAIQAIEWVCDGWNISNLLIPTPTFSTYYEYLEGKYRFTNQIWLGKTQNWQAIKSAALSNNCDSILLINPNNPSGEALDLEQLILLEQHLDGLKLIIDESFYHFLPNYEDYQSFRNQCSNKDIVFIKSLSKDFGIAGARLGYIYSNDEDLLRFCRNKTTWNLNNLAIQISEILSEESFITKYKLARQKYIDGRQSAYKLLSQIEQIKVYNSQSNFFLIKLNKPYPKIVHELLIDHGIYVRTMEDKIGLNNQYLRIAIRKREENEFLHRKLKEYFENN